MLLLTSHKVDDAKNHALLVRRSEATLGVELTELNDTFINQTTILTSDPDDQDSLTLSISADHIFLGAAVHVGDRSVLEGYEGCVTGVRLDRKDLPFSSDGSQDFALSFSSGGSGVVAGCPLTQVVESPLPDLYVYAALGSSLAFLLLISLVFVVVCAVGGAWKRSRSGDHAIQRNTSPSHGGFTWQPSHNSPLRKSPLPHDAFMMTDILNTSQSDQPDSRVRTVEMSSANRETVLSPTQDINRDIRSAPAHDRSRQGSQRSHGHHGNQDSQRSRGRRDNHSIQDSQRSHSSRQGSHLAVPPPVEGFTALSGPNPGYLQESPASSEQEVTPPVQHVRSLSGQQSVLSAASDATSIPTELLGKDDVEVRKHLLKKVEIADMENEELDMDKMECFNEEGPFEPLGSIGSLYDFLKNLEDSPSTQQAPEEGMQASIKVTGLTRLPARKPVRTSSAGAARGSGQPVSGNAREQPVSSHSQPSSPPVQGQGLGKRPRPVIVRGPSPVKSPSVAQPQPHPLQTRTSPLKPPPLTDGHLSPSPEPTTPHHLSPSPPTTSDQVPPELNGHWVPIAMHVGSSASQPEHSHVRENEGGGFKDPTKLRRSTGRHSHRVTHNTGNPPTGNILDKFHQVTTSGGRRNEETIAL